jgi:hypothetical protein
MLALAIIASLGTGRALRLAAAVGQLSQLVQLTPVEAHSAWLGLRVCDCRSEREGHTRKVRRKKLVLTLLFAAVLALLLWWFWSASEREPTYEGRTLSQWLFLYTKPGTSEEVEAVSAVRSIGTNSLPFLVKWVAYPPPAWRQKLARKVTILPTWLMKPRAQQLEIMKGSKELWAAIAATAFRDLGEQAASAVPELSKLLATYDPGRPPQAALDALLYIGNPGLPALAMVITNKSFPLDDRISVVRRLRPLTQTNTAVLVHILAGNCAEPELSHVIIQILGEFHSEPQITVPALVGCLRSRDVMTRMNASGALGQFGEEAGAAVPELMAASHDENPALRVMARDALRKIAPENLEEKWHHSEASPTDAGSGPDANFTPLNPR